MFVYIGQTNEKRSISIDKDLYDILVYTLTLIECVSKECLHIQVVRGLEHSPPLWKRSTWILIWIKQSHFRPTDYLRHCVRFVNCFNYNRIHFSALIHIYTHTKFTVDLLGNYIIKINIELNRSGYFFIFTSIQTKPYTNRLTLNLISILEHKHAMWNTIQWNLWCFFY